MAKILVVDDELVIRELVSETLALDAHEIRTAGSALEALAQAEAMAPDVVLLDLFMAGGMNGLEVCERLTRDHPGIRVILLTGARDDALRVAGRAAGACAYLTKPFSPLELIEQVEELLECTPDAGTHART